MVARRLGLRKDYVDYCLSKVAGSAPPPDVLLPKSREYDALPISGYSCRWADGRVFVYWEDGSLVAEAPSIEEASLIAWDDKEANHRVSAKDRYAKKLADILACTMRAPQTGHNGPQERA